MRALIYTRVSEDRAGGRSPAEQEAEARGECDRRGWSVVDVVTDTVGASRYSKGKRSGWKVAKELVESGTVDVLVTWEASRAQRDLAAYVELRELCSKAGVLWSYSGKIYDLSDSGDRFTTGLDALLAEREVGEMAGRIQRAIRANAVEGKPHGRLLYGYQRVYDDRTGALLHQEPREDQAAIVRRIFAEYLAGTGCRTIAAGLQRDGIVTGTGKAWKDAQVRRVLLNPGYVARRVHQGEVIGEAQWEPLVSDDTYDRAQALLTERRTYMTRIVPTARLLSGVGRCGVCGGKMITIHDRNKRKVYACREGYHVSRDMLKLDAYVTAVVLERLRRPDVADALAGTDLDDDHDDARQRVKELRAQLDDALEQFTSGELSGTMLARIEQRLQPQIDEAERSTRPRFTGLDIDVPDDDLEGWWEGLANEVRRSLIASLVAAVVVLPTDHGSRVFNPGHARVEFRG